MLDVPDDPESPGHEDPRASRGRPGTRAPHAWLDRRGDRISTLDLFGRRVVLLAGPGGEGWCARVRRAATRLRLPVDIHRIGTDGLSDPGGCPEAYGLEADGAVLVRPDGFVGWRARSTTAISEPTLEGALAALVGRPFLEDSS
jgi:hypothetical protein